MKKFIIDEKLIADIQEYIMSSKTELPVYRPMLLVQKLSLLPPAEAIIEEEKNYPIQTFPHNTTTLKP